VDIPSFADQCKDPRLKALLPLYKARNYPKSLSSEERLAWEQFRIHALTDGGNQSRQHKFFTRLEELASSKHLSQQQRYLLEELQLYGQSIMPDPDFAD
jgi:exodeoxyribonuclease-1